MANVHLWLTDIADMNKQLVSRDWTYLTSLRAVIHGHVLLYLAPINVMISV